MKTLPVALLASTLFFAGCSAGFSSPTPHPTTPNIHSTNPSRSCKGADAVLQRLSKNDTAPLIKAIRLRRLHCYDGSKLEDADISIGNTFFLHTTTANKIFIEEQVNTSEANDILTSIPVHFVDKPCDLEKEFTKRKSIIRTLDVTSFNRADVIHNIDSALNDIHAACIYSLGNSKK
jgi:hypothetical protein